MFNILFKRNRFKRERVYSLRERAKLRAESKQSDLSNDINIIEGRNIFYDIVGFITILLSGILLVSFISMDMNAPSIIDTVRSENVNNLLGVFGEYISSYSFLAFGYSSFIVPIALIYIGGRLIFKNSGSKIIGIILSSFSVMICLSIFLDIILYKFDFYKRGGLMGEMLREGLKSVFGDVGTIMIVFSALVITVLATTRRSLANILLSFREKISSIKKYNIIGKNNAINTEKEKRVVSAIEYIPIMYKKDVSNFEYGESPFIEKVSMINYYDKVMHSNNLSKNDYYANSTSENIKDYSKNDNNAKKSPVSKEERIDNIIEGIKNDNNEPSFLDSIDRNINYNDGDLGVSLAETIFGERSSGNSSYKPSFVEMDFKPKDKKNDIYVENVLEPIIDYKDFINKDYSLTSNKKEEFKKAIYESSIDNYPKYNAYKNKVLERTVSNNIEDNNNNKYNTEIYNEKNYSVSNANLLEENNEENENIAKDKKVDILERLKAEMEKNRKLKENITKSEFNSDTKESITNKKVFEFPMGYAAEREYNRADHIPGVKDKNEGPLDSFDIEDDKEYYNDEIKSDYKVQNEYIQDEEKQIESINIENDFDDNDNIEDIDNELHNKNFSNIKENKSAESKIEDKREYKNTKKDNASQYTMHLPTFETIQSNFDPKYVDKHYKAPSMDLLNRSIPINDSAMLEAIKQTAIQLENTLLDFSVEAHVTGVSRGPVVTRYELELAAGTRVSKISNLTDNIALALASESVRIIAPIPGRSVIGIEIPNKVRNAVYLREVLESSDFKSSKSDIPFVLGKGIYGNNVVTDLSDAPHLLVAGTTGSGKSVCLSTIILSLLYKFRPDELKFIFVDKKRVELSIYNGIPHLMSPVVSDEKKATVVLRHIVDIMERRYERMERFFVRNVKAYNEKVRQLMKDGETEFEGEPLELFPYIVVVIDELHNLMVVASKEVEDLISRLAGMSRAVGIHLIIATQRPSADVVTGVIKANLPTRIAFQVPNKTNSRIIIDMAGAEQLLGKGDALFCSSGNQMPERVQGAFVSDGEVKKVVDYLASQMGPLFDESLIASLEKSDNDDRNTDEEDILDEELWEDAVKTVSRTGKASASFLQRKLKIGYNRAARIVEIMERQGIVGPENGSKPREVLISYEE